MKIGGNFKFFASEAPKIYMGMTREIRRWGLTMFNTTFMLVIPFKNLLADEFLVFWYFGLFSIFFVITLDIGILNSSMSETEMSQVYSFLLFLSLFFLYVSLKVPFSFQCNSFNVLLANFFDHIAIPYKFHVDFVDACQN